MIVDLKRAVLLLFVVSVPFICKAQSRVKLTNLDSGKEIVFTTGSRIVYSTEEFGSKNVGEITEIYQDSLKVDNKTVQIKDIQTIGRRRRGSVFGSLILSILGGATIGTVLAPDPDPCPSCQKVSNENDGRVYDVITVGIGATLGTLGIIIGVRNSAKRIEEGAWQLDVLD